MFTPTALRGLVDECTFEKLTGSFLTHQALDECFAGAPTPSSAPRVVLEARVEIIVRDLLWPRERVLGRVDVQVPSHSE